jgi:hypothetical protein
MPNTVKYRGHNVSGPSPDLWSDCPVLELLENPGKGQYFFDDFTNVPTWSGVTTATLADKYNVYSDTGVIIGPSGEQGGGCRISIMDSDNDEGALQVNGGGFVISDAAADARPLWFEGSMKVTNFTGESVGVFMGLMQPASPANSLLVDGTAALAASKSYIGFQTLAAAPNTVRFVFADSTGTVQTWAANVKTLTAATYAKFGFKYDPDQMTKKIRIWVDGVEYTADAIDSTDIAAATFPDGDVLAPIFAAKTGEAADCPAFLKWWRCAQLART